MSCQGYASEISQSRQYPTVVWASNPLFLILRDAVVCSYGFSAGCLASHFDIMRITKSFKTLKPNFTVISFFVITVFACLGL
jgi:hypothetical protein